MSKWRETNRVSRRRPSSKGGGKHFDGKKKALRNLIDDQRKKGESRRSCCCCCRYCCDVFCRCVFSRHTRSNCLSFFFFLPAQVQEGRRAETKDGEGGRSAVHGMARDFVEDTGFVSSWNELYRHESRAEDKGRVQIILYLSMPAAPAAAGAEVETKTSPEAQMQSTAAAAAASASRRRKSKRKTPGTQTSPGGAARADAAEERPPATMTAAAAAAAAATPSEASSSQPGRRRRRGSRARRFEGEQWPLLSRRLLRRSTRPRVRRGSRLLARPREGERWERGRRKKRGRRRERFFFPAFFFRSRGIALATQNIARERLHSFFLDLEVISIRRLTDTRG